MYIFIVCPGITFFKKNFVSIKGLIFMVVWFHGLMVFNPTVECLSINLPFRAITFIKKKANSHDVLVCFKLYRFALLAKIIHYVEHTCFTWIHEKLKNSINFCFLKALLIVMKVRCIFKVGKMHISKK